MSFDLGAYSNFGALTFNPTTSGGATIGSTLTVSTLNAYTVDTSIVNASTINTSTLSAYTVDTSNVNASTINTNTINIQGLQLQYAYSGIVPYTGPNPFEVTLPFSYGGTSYVAAAQFQANGASDFSAATQFPILCSTTGVSSFIIWSQVPAVTGTYEIRYITCGSLPPPPS